jgi:hypothetical protein
MEMEYEKTTGMILDAHKHPEDVWTTLRWIASFLFYSFSDSHISTLEMLIGKLF